MHTYGHEALVTGNNGPAAYPQVVVSRDGSARVDRASDREWSATLKGVTASPNMSCLTDWEQWRGSWLLYLSPERDGEKGACHLGVMRIDPGRGDALLSFDIYQADGKHDDQRLLDVMGGKDIIDTFSKEEGNWYPQFDPKTYLSYGHSGDVIRVDANTVQAKCFVRYWEEAGRRSRFARAKSGDLGLRFYSSSTPVAPHIAYGLATFEDHAGTGATRFKVTAVKTSSLFRGLTLGVLDSDGRKLHKEIQTQTGNESLEAIFRLAGLDLHIEDVSAPKTLKPSIDEDCFSDLEIRSMISQLWDSTKPKLRDSWHGEPWYAVLIVLTKLARGRKRPRNYFGWMADQLARTNDPPRQGAVVFYDALFSLKRSRHLQRKAGRVGARRLARDHGKRIGDVLGGRLLFRVAAHEIGHILNLPHCDNGSTLMAQTGDALETIIDGGGDIATDSLNRFDDAARSWFAHAPDPAIAPGWAEFLSETGRETIYTPRFAQPMPVAVTSPLLQVAVDVLEPVQANRWMFVRVTVTNAESETFFHTIPANIDLSNGNVSVVIDCVRDEAIAERYVPEQVFAPSSVAPTVTLGRGESHTWTFALHMDQIALQAQSVPETGDDVIYTLALSYRPFRGARVEGWSAPFTIEDRPAVEPELRPVFAQGSAVGNDQIERLWGQWKSVREDAVLREMAGVALLVTLLKECCKAHSTPLISQFRYDALDLQLFAREPSGESASLAREVADELVQKADPKRLMYCF
ncbi:MAG: hypothetical protein ACI9W2_002680, partial [Gammaproteobacteria bacterium]